MEDILRGARCSKGRFYYYFHAKAELLDSLYEIFDQKYIELYGLICRDAHARDQLLEINRYMFQFLSNEIGAELLTSLYISQLSGTSGGRSGRCEGFCRPLCPRAKSWGS